MKVSVDKEKCIGCGTCVSLCEECFELVNGISQVKKSECAACDLKEVAASCPTEAITVKKE